MKGIIVCGIMKFLPIYPDFPKDIYVPKGQDDASVLHSPGDQDSATCTGSETFPDILSTPHYPAVRSVTVHHANLICVHLLASAHLSFTVLCVALFNTHTVREWG